MKALEARIVELEIQVALQEDLIGTLSDTVANMQQALDLQQAQLRLLYQRQQDRNPGSDVDGYSAADEIPPHY